MLYIDVPRTAAVTALSLFQVVCAFVEGVYVLSLGKRIDYVSVGEKVDCSRLSECDDPADTEVVREHYSYSAQYVRTSFVTDDHFF